MALIVVRDHVSEIENRIAWCSFAVNACFSCVVLWNASCYKVTVELSL